MQISLVTVTIMVTNISLATGWLVAPTLLLLFILKATVIQRLKGHQGSAVM